jgi:hypothetical protein
VTLNFSSIDLLQYPVGFAVIKLISALNKTGGVLSVGVALFDSVSLVVLGHVWFS